MTTSRFLLPSDPARFGSLPDILRSVILPAAPMTDEVFHRLHLAIYELLVNISRHAYRRHNGVIEVEVSVGPISVLVSAFDTGSPYHGPLHPNMPCEPTVGGYGLPLIDAVADNIRYSRVGRENHWQLEFIHTEAGSQ